MRIWKKEISTAILNQRNQKTLSDHLGIRFTEVGDDFVKAEMPLTPSLMQPMGIMHGGASCALAETIASAASNYCIESENEAFVGIEINTNHIRSVKQGVLTATAKPIHIGKSTQVWEILIQNENNNLISINRLTLMKIKK